jgi:SOS-response transcriptional repressor LexA
MRATKRFRDQEPAEYNRTPVMGQVAAGASIEYLPTVEWREVRLPDWARDGDRFVLSEVCGDSLSGAGIYDGDFALIHINAEDIRDGDLIAALTPDGMLIKFFWHNYDNRVRLEGANPSWPVRYYEPEDITIQGKVIRTERDW